jgi:hypothetical protein
MNLLLWQKINRYVPLAAWIAVILTIILIPLKIISLGFLPPDDALRHAAKAVSGKSWQQILVMRSDFAIDPSPGWQTILEWLHHLSGCGAEALVVFSVVVLMLMVNLIALPWVRRPEAWLAAVFVAAVFIPSFITRIALGRPYIFTQAILIMLLLLWGREQNQRPRNLTLGLTVLGIAVSAWIHGSWYLWVLPAAAIFFAGLWRPALWYVGCWLTGSFLGSALTGHPWEFLIQSVEHMFGVFGHLVVNRQLEPEMYPSDGDPLAVIVVSVLLLWRASSSRFNPRALLNPIFIMMILGWVLGLRLRRFWWDWGTPAFIVWVALELQDRLDQFLNQESVKRLFITLGLAAGLFLAFTSDFQGRWTKNLTDEYLSLENPDIKDWLPESGGILYAADMSIFFETFYKNPTAPWKYVLGFEPGLMTPENLTVLREIQWNYSDLRTYEPWVKKMRHEDRLVIRAFRASGAPGIPELEWNYAATDLWVGRLPRTTNVISLPPQK